MAAVGHLRFAMRVWSTTKSIWRSFSLCKNWLESTQYSFDNMQVFKTFASLAWKCLLTRLPLGGLRDLTYTKWNTRIDVNAKRHILRQKYVTWRIGRQDRSLSVTWARDEATNNDKERNLTGIRRDHPYWRIEIKFWWWASSNSSNCTFLLQVPPFRRSTVGRR